MSWLWRLLAVLVVVGIVAWIGTTAYNAGVSAGLAEAARLAEAPGDGAVVVPSYGWGGPYWGPGYGIGPLGFILLTFLGIFLVIGLVRFIVGRPRWGGPGPGGGWRDRRFGAEEWHRELHRRESGDGPQQAAGA